MTGMAVLRDKWANLKLRTKLILTFLVTILAVSTVITAVIGFSTKMFFVAFVQQHNNMRKAEFKAYFEDYYRRNQQSWEGIQEIIAEPTVHRPKIFSREMPSIDRIIVVGTDGLVIADSEGTENIGKPSPKLDIQIEVDIEFDNKPVGKVIIGANPPPAVAVLQEQFFNSVLSASILASVVAIVLAIWLALQFSRRISIPLVSLTEAAGKLADKEFKYRLFIPAKDEIGTLAKAFNSMADAIEQNEQIRNNLVADVAHELRTPVTIIRGTLESLQAGVLEPSQEVIVSLHDEVLRLSRLINELQEISLAESGKLVLNISEINPVDIVEKVVNNFKGPASAKGIEIRLAVALAEGRIEADYDRIVQVLANLLSNAIRHTPAGGQIEVALAESGSDLCISVTDSGPGISPEDLPYIFDRFYRGSKARSRVDGGSGLGLSIARSLVEIHHGRIEALSSPGAGSVFTVYLPRSE